MNMARQDMTDRELMRQALAALENCEPINTGISWGRQHLRAMDALRDRLARQEQERKPCVHCGQPLMSDLTDTCYSCGQKPLPERRQVTEREDAVLRRAMLRGARIINPPPAREWQGLTDEEIESIGIKHAPPVHPDFDDDDWYDFARAIEAKLKEKNA